MSGTPRGLLSGEEIEAILASASEVAQGEESRFRRAAGASDGADFAWTPVARMLRDFGEEQARLLSTLYQRSISLRLCDLRSLPAGDFAASMIAHDCPFLLRFGSDQSAGALLLGRTLLYGWLTLCFGGQIDGSPPVVPDRRPTRIETRFLTSAAAEILRHLETAIARLLPVKLELGPIVEPELLAAQTAPRLLVASFDACGFGEVARLRLGLPDGLFQVDKTSPRRALGKGSGSRDLAERLHAMPLSLRAEVGGAEIALGRLRALHPGDVVALRPSAHCDVLVRVEGEPRFRAVRGSVGNRLAIRITERL